MEQIIESPPEPKAAKRSDRVTLSEEETKKLDGWRQQLEASSKGFLSVTRTDLVNFLIREHREELQPAEIKRIRASLYDPIRHIQWITPQIKAALAQGDSVRVAELQEELRGVELSAMKAVIAKAESAGVELPRKRDRRSKVDQNEEVKFSKTATSIDEIEEK